MMGESPIHIPSIKPVKRSIFSRKLVAKRAEPEEDVEYFSRAAEKFAQQVAEEEGTRREEAGTHLKKRSSTQSEDTEEEGKRRRISIGEDASFHEDNVETVRNRNESWLNRESTQSSSPSSRTASSSKPPIISLTAHYAADLKNAKVEEMPNGPAIVSHIDLSSDTEDEDVKAQINTAPLTRGDIAEDDPFDSPQQPIKTAPEYELLVSDDDEELADIIRRARERAKQKEPQKLTTTKTALQTSFQYGDDIFGEESTPERLVKILITSRLEGSSKLIVMRKPEQYLREVRYAWCDRNQFLEPNFRDKVFFTWKKKKVFDLTTCKSLMQSGADDEANEGIHLEAWTSEAFDIFQKNQIERDRRAQEEGEDLKEEAPVKRIKLVLRAADIKDFKLQVKPTTTVDAMLAAFREAREIQKGMVVTLNFDGYVLEPDSKVEDLDIEDLDILEVHVR